MSVWFLQSLIPLSAKYEHNMDKRQGMEILVLPEELAKALQEVPFVRDLERQGGVLVIESREKCIAFRRNELH